VGAVGDVIDSENMFAVIAGSIAGDVSVIIVGIIVGVGIVGDVIVGPGVTCTVVA